MTTKKVRLIDQSIDEYIGEAISINKTNIAVSDIQNEVDYFRKLRESNREEGKAFFKNHRAALPNVFPVFVQNRSANYSTGRLESSFSILGMAVFPQAEKLALQNLNAVGVLKNDTTIDFGKLAEERLKHKTTEESDNDEDN